MSRYRLFVEKAGEREGDAVYGIPYYQAGLMVGTVVLQKEIEDCVESIWEDVPLVFGGYLNG